MALRSNSPYELEALLLQKMSLKFDLTERGLKRAFSSYDRDGNGLLSLKELVDAIQIYLNGIPRKDVKRLLKCYDANGDGYISFEEFYDMLSTRCATCAKTGVPRGRNTRPPPPNRNNLINNLDEVDCNAERERHLEEKRRNREADEAVSILSQARALEDMCAEIKLDIKNRDKLKAQDERFAAACDASLRSRKEAGKPLYPIYSAIGYREPDLMPVPTRSAHRRRSAGGEDGVAYETDLGGTGSARPVSRSLHIRPATGRRKFSKGY